MKKEILNILEVSFAPLIVVDIRNGGQQVNIVARRDIFRIILDEVYHELSQYSLLDASLHSSSRLLDILYFIQISFEDRLNELTIASVDVIDEELLEMVPDGHLIIYLKENNAEVLFR